MPRVSVLMAVKDARPYVEAAARSILAQTFTDFEFVVVDDGSADGTGDLVRALGDPRIRILRNDVNQGIARSLNRALAESSGELVARMDGDDRAHPERLAKQVAHLDAHPDVGLVACRVQTVDPSGEPNRVDYDPPAGEALVLWNLLLFTNPICHPSVLFRRALLERSGTYVHETWPSEDRDLWTRMLPHTRIHVLPDRLLDYRLHPDSISQSKRAQQIETSLAVRRRALAWFLGDRADTSAILAWYRGRMTPDEAFRLLELFLVVYRRMGASGRWGRDEMELVRADLAQRITSLRRRSEARGLLRRARRLAGLR